MAHRGFSGEYPENTMLAFQQAIALGVDMIELDVHLTKDEQIVISHDANLKRCAGIDYDIADLEYRKIRGLNLPHAQYIPLLSEVLRLLYGYPKITLNIEIKSPEVVPFLVELIQKERMSQRILFSSFQAGPLLELQDLMPQVPIAIISGDFPPEKLDLYIKQAKFVNAKYMNMAQTTLNAEIIDYLHREGFQINGWTPNTIEEMQRLLGLNVDIITTNYPNLLKELIKSNAVPEILN
jgi:glycerophosphoryl diester phosphodiesterase